jgi:hypothetical protein
MAGVLGGIDYETNPILFKPAWKSYQNEAKNEPNSTIDLASREKPASTG